MPAICPECEILLRPVFFERLDNNKIIIPNTNPKELATAIMETINSGAKIINLSLGMSPNSLVNYRELEQVYDYACRHGVVIIPQLGNQGNIGSISLVNHPWVIPVAACNQQGQSSKLSNFGHSVKRHGLMAPGENITSTALVEDILK